MQLESLMRVYVIWHMNVEAEWNWSKKGHSAIFLKSSLANNQELAALKVICICREKEKNDDVFFWNVLSLFGKDIVWHI